jgi:predicted aspartyl protease
VQSDELPTVVRADPDNHLLVEADVNNKGVRLAFDTGAGMAALSRPAVARLGIGGGSSSGWIRTP